MTDAEPGRPASLMDGWQRAEVQNEAHFRELNEWTRAAHDDEGVEHVWEVFALATNHENPELDLVVSEHGRYTVVEKWLREAASIAYATDPRR